MTDIDDPLLEIEQRELAEKAEKRKLKELEIAIKKTLETVEGRRVFQWILDMTAVDSSVTSQDMTLMTIASASRSSCRSYSGTSGCDTSGTARNLR